HQLNAPEALHCSGCGYALGLEPIYGHSELGCATCTGTLSCFRAPSGRLYDCSQCGGQFVEQALLKRLLERREVAGALLPRKPRQYNPLAQPLMYRACPACRQIMHRRNFGGTSGIILDVCAEHGLWFDTGELPQVLKFVEEGGLALARRLQAEGSLTAWKLPDKPRARFEVYRDSPETPKPELSVFETVASIGIGL